MRRLKILFLLIFVLISTVAWLPSALAWPEISAESFAGHRRWREERQEEKRRAVQERRDERHQERHQERNASSSRREQTEPVRRQEDANAERRALSPEERQELRRQIRRANQDGKR